MILVQPILIISSGFCWFSFALKEQEPVSGGFMIYRIEGKVTQQWMKGFVTQRELRILLT